MFEFNRFKNVLGMFEYEEIQKELFQLYTAKKVLERYGINTRIIDKRIIDYYDMIDNINGGYFDERERN